METPIWLTPVFRLPRFLFAQSVAKVRSRGQVMERKRRAEQFSFLWLHADAEYRVLSRIGCWAHMIPAHSTLLRVWQTWRCTTSRGTKGLVVCTELILVLDTNDTCDLRHVVCQEVLNWHSLQRKSFDFRTSGGRQHDITGTLTRSVLHLPTATFVARHRQEHLAIQLILPEHLLEEP